jgi:hypothetical protein
LTGFFFDPEDEGYMLMFIGLHGVITQKIEFFVTSAVIVPNSLREAVCSSDHTRGPLN